MEQNMNTIRKPTQTQIRLWISAPSQLTPTKTATWWLTVQNDQTERSLPASPRWHPCRPAATLCTWWWTWHLRLLGYVFVRAGLPGAELFQHVYGLNAGPESVAGSSAWLCINVVQPARDDKSRMWVSSRTYVPHDLLEYGLLLPRGTVFIFKQLFCI